MEKTVKARKDHRCSQCGGTIHKGEKYLFGSWKEPVYDDFDNQIGVVYSKARMCRGCEEGYG